METGPSICLDKSHVGLFPRGALDSHGLLYPRGEVAGAVSVARGTAAQGTGACRSPTQLPESPSLQGQGRHRGPKPDGGGNVVHAQELPVFPGRSREALACVSTAACPAVSGSWESPT